MQRTQYFLFFAKKLGYLNDGQIQSVSSNQETSIEHVLSSQNLLSKQQISYLRLLVVRHFLLLSAIQRGHITQEQYQALLYAKNWEQLTIPTIFFSQIAQQYVAQNIFTKDDYTFISTLFDAPPNSEKKILATKKYVAPHKQTLTQLGPYQLTKELGAGGMGKVYKGYHPGLDKTVAIKVMLASNISEKERARFISEAKLTSRLQHPNIVGLHSIEEDQGKDYIVMDFIEGDSLATILKKHPPSVIESLKFMRDIALAMDYAHELGIVHRDLKPANIMIEKDSNKPLIMDFGLAKNIKNSGNLTRSGAILGTPRYMAPEQAAGKTREISPVTDVYTLGAILYQMLSGEYAVTGELPANIIFKILYKDVKSPRQHNSKLAIDLETICLKALEKEPQRRYPSAKAFAEDIERYLNGEVILARPATFWYSNWKRIKRNKSIAALVVGIVVLLGSWYYWQQQQKREKIAQITSKINIFLKKGKNREKGENFLSYLNDKYKRKERIIDVEEQQEHKKILKKYAKKRIQLQSYLLLFPGNGKLRKTLYEVERHMGEIALKGHNFLLSEIFFEHCRSLDEKKAVKLFARLELAKNEIKQIQIKRIEKIMIEGEKNPPAEIVDVYVAEIAKMKGEHILTKVVPYINSKHRWQRKIARAALGQLKDTTTKVENKDAVEWLLEQLKQLVSKDETPEIKEVIWALGWLGDLRAKKPIYEIRYQRNKEGNIRYHKQSRFYQDTLVPYNWLNKED